MSALSAAGRRRSFQLSLSVPSRAAETLRLLSAICRHRFCCCSEPTAVRLSVRLRSTQNCCFSAEMADTGEPLQELEAWKVLTQCDVTVVAVKSFLLCHDSLGTILHIFPHTHRKSLISSTTGGVETIKSTNTLNSTHSKLF